MSKALGAAGAGWGRHHYHPLRSCVCWNVKPPHGAFWPLLTPPSSNVVDGTLWGSPAGASPPLRSRCPRRLRPTGTSRAEGPAPRSASLQRPAPGEAVLRPSHPHPRPWTLILKAGAGKACLSRQERGGGPRGRRKTKRKGPTSSQRTPCPELSGLPAPVGPCAGSLGARWLLLWPGAHLSARGLGLVPSDGSMPSVPLQKASRQLENPVGPAPTAGRGDVR